MTTTDMEELHPVIENDSPSQVGDFALDEDTRTLRGILLPFGERSRRSATGHEVEFAADSITLPRDPSVVTLNRKHNRHDPIGRATVLEKRDAGIYAEFRVADTDEGDQYLAEQRGTIRKLSAEVTDLITEGARAIKSRLTGAALVPEGAFASAALFELAADDEANERLATPAEVAEATPDTQAETAPVAEQTPPSAEPKEEVRNMADAIVPDGVDVTPAQVEEKALSLNGLFEAIAYAKRSGDYSSLEQVNAAGNALFALTDVKVSGSGQLGTATLQPQWLGELWTAVRKRVVIPSVKHADLVALEVKGFKFTTKPTVGTWTGNKTEIPSPAIGVTAVSGSLQRFAAGYDIAREFFDIPAGAPVIESFIRNLAESYAVVSDDYVLAQMIASAGTAVDDSEFATLNSAQSKILTGALDVIANGGNPTFAFVASDVYAEYITTPKDKVTEFLSAGGSLTEGSYSGIIVRPHTGMTAGQVLVGDRNAVTVFELPGSPVRVSALEVAKGGVDEAVFGYVGYLAEAPELLSLVDTAE